MNVALDIIAILEKSYEHHLKEMCRHDAILEWIIDEIEVLEIDIENNGVE